MKIEKIDHLVLTVKDIPRTLKFYVAGLGMKKVIFANNRIALKFGDSKINLHESGKEFKPHAQNAKAGSADLCFINNDSLDNTIKHLKQHEINIIEGPILRTGALGPINSIYVRDPDGNLIEISVYE